MKTAAFVSVWAALQFASQIALAADAADPTFELSNGSHITFEQKTGNYRVNTADGKVRVYKPGAYLNLLKGTELSNESREKRAEATRFVINTVAPLSEQNAPHDRVEIQHISSDQMSQLDRVMGGSAKAASSAQAQPERQKVVMSAAELADFLGPNGSHQVKYVPATNQRISNLGKAPSPADAKAPSKAIAYGYVGRMASNRAGSKAFAVGAEIDHNYGFEYSCEDEGKQPSDANGPIRNINRICNMDAVKYFPFTDKFEVYIEGGVTRQGGHQGEPGYKYRVPEQWDGYNVGAGMKENINRHVAIELRTRFAHYEQLNPNNPPDAKWVNGRIVRDGPYINNGHNPEDIGAKLLTSLGIRFQWGPGTRAETPSIK